MGKTEDQKEGVRYQVEEDDMWHMSQTIDEKREKWKGNGEGRQREAESKE